MPGFHGAACARVPRKWSGQLRPALCLPFSRSMSMCSPWRHQSHGRRLEPHTWARREAENRCCGQRHRESSSNSETLRYHARPRIAAAHHPQPKKNRAAMLRRFHLPRSSPIRSGKFSPNRGVYSHKSSQYGKFDPQITY